MTARTAVVIGGGLAGITAAIELRDAGVGVTLLEARPRLGGATPALSRRGRAPGPVRRPGAAAARPGQAAPVRAAGPAAPGRVAGQLPLPVAAGTAPGGARGPRPALPRPGRAR